MDAADSRGHAFTTCRRNIGQRRQQTRRAFRKQVEVRRECVLVRWQIPMFAIDLPGSDAGNARADKRHAAVACLGRIEIFKSRLAHFVTVGGEASPARHEQQLVLEWIEIAIELNVETLAERDRAIDHVLWRDAPPIRV